MLGASALAVPFAHFQEFCRNEGFCRPDGLDGLEYLTGVCSIPVDDSSVVDFLVVNSAWFSRPGGGDIRKLWLGLPLLEELAASAYCSPPAADKKRVRLGLCHHPREWLHPEEHDSYTTRPNTFRFFAERCDIMLNGHVHGSLEPPSLAHNAAQTFTGGATYAGGRYRNNFSLLQVNFEDFSVRRRGFEFDPRVAEWSEMPTAAGAYQLNAVEQESPDTAHLDISGMWRGEWWPEHPGDLRKDSQTMVVRSSPDDDLSAIMPDRPGTRFLGQHTDEDRSELYLDGGLADGFFSGLWHDSKRYGTFQMKLLRSGTVLWGRWLGFDKHHEIRVGVWRFVRVGDGS